MFDGVKPELLNYVGRLSDHVFHRVLLSLPAVVEIPLDLNLYY